MAYIPRVKFPKLWRFTVIFETGEVVKVSTLAAAYFITQVKKLSFRIETNR